MRWEFFDVAADFLEVAGDRLARDPVRNTILTTVAHRHVGRPVTGRPFWFAVVRDDAGAVAGAAMRTAPDVPYRAYFGAMPTGAGALLAEVLRARGEQMPAANGNLQATVEYADRLAELTDGRTEIDVRIRQFEATAVTVPPAPAGALREAGLQDLDLLARWHRDFAAAAEEQGGRSTGSHHVLPTPEDLRSQLETGGGYWLWGDPDGRPAHFTAVSPPAFGVCRIGPVYTPAEYRGRGIAGHVVGVLTRRILDAGHRACLFTDQANPTANALYQGLGYRALGDTVELSVVA